MAFSEMEVWYLKYVFIMHGLLILARCKWVFSKMDLCTLEAPWQEEDSICWRDPYQDVSPLIPVYATGASRLVLWQSCNELVRKTFLAMKQ